MNSASWIGIAVGAFLPLLVIILTARRTGPERPGKADAEGRK